VNDGTHPPAGGDGRPPGREAPHGGGHPEGYTLKGIPRGHAAGKQAGQQGIAAAITEVSERASLLIREEIELAKTEITEKTTRLAKGAVVGIVAGVFFLTALFFVLIGLAWLLYYELPIGNEFTYFWGFFAMALILVVLGAIAGLLAARAVKSGSPPTPDMAIEEARKIRETVSSSSDAQASAAAFAPSSGSAPAAAHPEGHRQPTEARETEQDGGLGRETTDGTTHDG
jgi:hypothetical protein